MHILWAKLTANSKQLMESGKIKVGDLLHSNKLGGHIGILIGMDDDYYLWGIFTLYKR